VSKKDQFRDDRCGRDSLCSAPVQAPRILGTRAGHPAIFRRFAWRISKQAGQRSQWQVRLAM